MFKVVLQKSRSNGHFPNMSRSNFLHFKKIIPSGSSYAPLELILGIYSMEQGMEDKRQTDLKVEMSKNPEF